MNNQKNTEKPQESKSSKRQVDAMVRKPIRRCCWCGKQKKRMNWTSRSCIISAQGKGKRYYWNCGCLDSHNFNEFTQLLFEEGKDYPDKFKKVS